MITIDPPLETLTTKEKMELLNRVWDSLDPRPEEDAEVPEWHDEVLRERLAAAERGENPSVPFEEAMERLKKRLS